MNKPFTLKVQETSEQIVEVLNNSELPAFALKIVLENLHTQLDNLDKEEIAKYEEEIKKENKEKESEK